MGKKVLVYLLRGVDYNFRVQGVCYNFTFRFDERRYKDEVALISIKV
jgi:hypothetical protein